MKKTQNQNTTPPPAQDHEAVVRASTLAAHAAEMENISTIYERFERATRNIETGAIDAANLSRELGLNLQALCGHEQISFQFWQNNCEGKLKFDFDSAKMFCSIARKLPQPAKSLPEAVSYIQPALVASGFLEVPERTGEQEASFVNPFQKFLKYLTCLGQPYKKLLLDRPMKNWTRGQLESFTSETLWIVEEREKAERLLS